MSQIGWDSPYWVQTPDTGSVKRFMRQSKITNQNQAWVKRGISPVERNQSKILSPKYKLDPKTNHARTTGRTVNTEEG